MKNIPVPKRVIDIKHRRRIRRLRLFGLFLFIFLIFIGGTAYFSFNENITIDKIVVKGNSIIDEADISKMVKDQLAGRYLYIYSRANSFIYPERQIYKDLITNFPRIEELKIVRNNLKTIKIDIKERLGSYLYCGNEIPELESEIGENCYFINNDGYIFDNAPYFSGNVYFKFYSKINENVGPLNQNILSIERFHELVRFIDNITSLGFLPVYLVIKEDGMYSLYLINKGEKSPIIIFKDDNDLENIFDNLKTAMNTKEFSEEVNSNYNTLSYIDLRFKGKVLYKFNNE